MHPISIRDQMVRARLAVDAVIERKWVDAKHPLLVVGGGVAGVTAAIYASQRQLNVHLAEKTLLCFSVQSPCSSRVVDPLQYDWPAIHWDQRRYPPPPLTTSFPPTVAVPFATTPGMTTLVFPPPITRVVPVGATTAWSPPLLYDRNDAASLAARWAGTLTRAKAHFPTLLTFVNCSVDQPAFHSVPVPTGARARAPHVQFRFMRADKSLKTPLPPSGTRYGAVLLCRGHGEERTSLGPGRYRGFGFWQLDPFGRANVGLPVGTKPRVVISGAGDGALQDYIRITTRKSSAADVYTGLHISAAAELAVVSAEDQFQRFFAQARTSKQEHDALVDLQSAHLRAAQVAYAEPFTQRALEGLLPAPGILDVRLIHGCTHFGHCYALNRFLVLLIALHLDTQRVRTLYPQQRVIDVRPTAASGHACLHPASCHGKDHDVDVESYRSCYGPTGAPLPSTIANVIVLRHGVQLSTKAGPSRPMRRQFMPFYLHP